jgi:hypothetical protein
MRYRGAVKRVELRVESVCKEVKRKVEKIEG